MTLNILFVQDMRDTLQIRLQNIVATVNLGTQLDLVSSLMHKI